MQKWESSKGFNFRKHVEQAARRKKALEKKPGIVMMCICQTIMNKASEFDRFLFSCTGDKAAFCRDDMETAVLSFLGNLRLGGKL